MARLDELKRALLKADQAGDIASARVLTRAIDKMMQTSPVQEIQDQTTVTEDIVEQPEEMGRFAKIKDVFTGESRMTPEMESLPSVGRMPELDKISMAGLKSALVTMTGDDEESVKALQANFPGVEARTDEKGNLIVKSAIDGQEYAVNKPGLDTRDLVKAGLVAAMFSPTGRVGGALARVGTAAGIQTGIETGQAAAGGEFNPGQIALAGTTESIAPGLSKVATGAKGLVRRGTKTAAQEAVQGAEEAGVRALTSDVIPPNTFIGKLGQATSERIPFVGTGPVRAAQQTQRTEAVRNILREYGADQFALASDDVMEELLKKRSKDISKYTNLKTEVIDRLNANGTVDVTKTLKTIDDEIAKLKSLKTKGVDSAIDIFEDYKTAFEGQDLKNIELLRKQLGEQLKDPNLAQVRSTAEKSVSKIYNAARDDMGKFIKETGERRDFTKWGVANKQLSKMLNELEVGTLKSTLKKGDATPELIRRMIFSKKPSEIKLLYKNLNQDGRNKAKVAILQEVVQKAGGIDDITPEKFLTQMRKMEGSTKIFFNKEDKKVFNGLVKALKLTKRAGESGVKPITGAELTGIAPPVILTQAFGLGPGAAAYGGIGGVARIYESRPVRNLLLQLGSAKPGKEKVVVDKLVNLLQSKRQLNQEESEK